jgi:hypothetical protein
MIADFIGAFIGAVVVYCLYQAHFSLLPPPPKAPQWTDNFVRPLNIPSRTREAFISYEPLSAGSSATPSGLRRRRCEVRLLMPICKAYMLILIFCHIGTANGCMPCACERSYLYLQL